MGESGGRCGDRVVEELGVAEASVNEVHVGAQGEGGVVVAEPFLDLFELRPASKRSEAHVWRKM